MVVSAWVNFFFQFFCMGYYWEFFISKCFMIIYKETRQCSYTRLLQFSCFFSKCNLFCLSCICQKYFHEILILSLYSTSSHSKGSLKGHYSSGDLPSHSECTSYEPPLVNSLSLQWFLLCFTNCLPFKVRPTIRVCFFVVFYFGNFLTCLS